MAVLKLKYKFFAAEYSNALKNTNETVTVSSSGIQYIV
jgi:hypothetical protein